uniref:Uncharacterized protein n=1 Tax=Oncorhynchus tshawytscha TaxID=74940 RepID=A0AAZ3NNP6_ONCTS
LGTSIRHHSPNVPSHGFHLPRRWRRHTHPASEFRCLRPEDAISQTEIQTKQLCVYLVMDLCCLSAFLSLHLCVWSVRSTWMRCVTS